MLKDNFAPIGKPISDAQFAMLQRELAHDYQMYPELYNMFTGDTLRGANPVYKKIRLVRKPVKKDNPLQLKPENMF